MCYAKRWVSAVALLAAFLVATSALAQAPADNSANQNGQQSSQQANSAQQSEQQNSTSQSADQQNQNQSSSANNTGSSSGNAQQGANQTTSSADNSRSQTNQDSSPALEPPANNQQSGRDSSTDRSTSARSSQQDQRGSGSASGRTSAQDRQDSRRDEAGSQYDNRTGPQYDNRNDNRDRSGHYDQRNSDDRSMRTDQSVLRDQRSSRRAEMRAPDMGLWFNRSSRDGLVIADVAPRGAIAKFGFREGDRIVSINGRPVTSEAEFMDYVFHGNAERVNVVVFRNGREQTIVVEPTVFTEEYENPPVNPLERFGVILDDRYDDRIVVWRVIPYSPAYYAGFRPGDVIASFSGRPYRTRTDFETSVGTWNPGEANVQIRRGDRPRELSVDIPVFNRSMERSARRGDRIEQRPSIRNDNNQTPNNRPGILNGPGLRGRGNR